MLKNYLKVAVRNLRRRKGYAFIKISGLALGVACCLLILLYVQDELSYDRFYPNADRIYRVAVNESGAGFEASYPLTPFPLAAALAGDYPEVVHATRLAYRDPLAVGYEDKLFDETRIHRADSNFFEVFPLSFLKGDPKTALKNPSSVVITASMAQKYFGEDEPLGKVLDFKDGITYSTPYTVTGVIEDLPPNAHFHVDFLTSWLRVGDQRRLPQSWLSYSIYTYVLLDAHQRPEALEVKFSDMVKRYVGSQIEATSDLSFEGHLAAGRSYRYFLQPVTAIHLHSNMGWEIEPNGNATYVYLFAVIALFILLLAGVNYINLVTARSAGRAREIGMRKVLGSHRRQLVAQVLLESVLVACIACCVALVLVQLFLPVFNTFADKQLSIAFLGAWFVLPMLVGAPLVIGILAGSYPAFFLSSFRPIVVLKGGSRQGRPNTAFRNGLVVFQFVVSLVLLVGAFVVNSQMRYLLDKDLGFDREQVIIIEKAWALGNQRASFKQEILGNPAVVSLSVAEAVPGRLYDDRALYPEDPAPGEEYTASLLLADHDYVETLGLEMARGRAFSEAFPTDSNAVVVNEAAVKMLRLTGDPIGQRIAMSSESGTTYPIIGVIKDFHFKSLHQDINALVYFIGEKTMSYVAARVRAEDVPATLAYLEDRWKAFVPDKPFKYSLLDEDVDALYHAEQKTRQIFGGFSVLAMLIACLGLFGLAAFMAEQRRKEIGVRKVLGASVPGIVLLLSREFLKLVSVAFVIASPVAYLAMSRWLEGFAYRTGISGWIFLGVGALAAAVALVTVGFQAIRAAQANPVEALRHE